AYVRAAVERDLSGETGDPANGDLSDIMVRVARAVAPGYADDLADECDRLDVDQPKLMAQILEALYFALDGLREDEARQRVNGQGMILLDVLPREARKYTWEVRPNLLAAEDRSEEHTSE